MQLHYRHDSVIGRYRFNTSPEWTELRGSQKANTLALTEIIADKHKAKQAASFRLVARQDHMRLTGAWRSPKNKKPVRVILRHSGYLIFKHTRKKHIADPAGGQKKVPVETTYPVLQGIDGRALEKQIDNYLRLHVYSYAYTSKTIDNRQKPVSAAIQYEILYSDSNVFSVTINGTGNDGSGHRNTFGHTVSINLHTGKPVTAEECFRTNVLNNVNEFILKALGCGLPIGDAFEVKCLSLTPKSTNFAITNCGLEINGSDCLPRSEQGCAHTVIPYLKLRAYLNPAGPISKFVH